MSMVKREGRICFGIQYYDDEAEAEREGRKVFDSGRTFNGGFFHGAPCGRSKRFDHIDKETGKQLYAITC